MPCRGSTARCEIGRAGSHVQVGEEIPGARAGRVAEPESFLQHMFAIL